MRADQLAACTLRPVTRCEPNHILLPHEGNHRTSERSLLPDAAIPVASLAVQECRLTKKHIQVDRKVGIKCPDVQALTYPVA